MKEHFDDFSSLCTTIVLVGLICLMVWGGVTLANAHTTKGSKLYYISYDQLSNLKWELNGLNARIKGVVPHGSACREFRHAIERMIELITRIEGSEVSSKIEENVTLEFLAVDNRRLDDKIELDEKVELLEDKISVLKIRILKLLALKKDK